MQRVGDINELGPEMIGVPKPATLAQSHEVIDALALQVELLRSRVSGLTLISQTQWDYALGTAVDWVGPLRCSGAGLSHGLACGQGDRPLSGP